MLSPTQAVMFADTVVAHQQPQYTDILLMLKTNLCSSIRIDSLFDSLPSSPCPLRQLAAEASRRDGCEAPSLS